MKVIKRNGAEVDFSREKIYKAIKSANEEVRSFDEKDAASDATINTIATRLYERCRKRTRATSVEEIQDMIETELMKEHAYETAKRYIRYRYWRSQVRQRNTTDDQILALIENDNEEVKQENSNKNPTVVSVQRDYMAGEVSKDLTKRFLLPADVMKAHEEGLIHFHDADYFAQHMHNCDLINLEDMLQNGTVISGTMIEKPHSFSTACNIATQIIAQVASSQYGGQSISLTHLAPFVDISRQKIREEIIEADDIKIIRRAMKGQNAYAASTVLEALSETDGSKEVILMLDEIPDETGLETICWIWDTNFELLNDPSIKKIIVSGKRHLDHRLRLLEAGIDPDKLVDVEDDEEICPHLIKDVQNIFVLYDIMALKRSRAVCENIIKEIKAEL